MTSSGSTGPTTPTPVAQRAPVDLRPLVTSPIMDQGARPLCVPLSVSFAHEAAAGQAMAPEAIWWACSDLGLVSAGGMVMRDAGDALARTGQPNLSNWPYNPHLGAATEEPPPGAGRPAWHVARLRSLQLAHDGQENQLEDTLAASQPVVLVVEVTAEFENPDPAGFIDVPDVRSPIGDYHAVLVVGAAYHRSSRHLLIRNTWSEYWGAGGYGWLPVDYLIANVGPASAVEL